jgi:hypothetical protein
MDNNSHSGPRNEQLAFDIFRNLEQIITGSSPLIRVDQDEEAKNNSINALLPFQDIASYRARLKSYSPSLYFAKPLLLSPLVCARFGWCCTGKDIIQCVECNSVIAVIFHPDLSLDSYRQLELTYHEMLATSHKSMCPFAMDAVRWLIMNSNNNNNNKNNKNDSGTDVEKEKTTRPLDQLQPFVVPPYLIPMSKGFQIMEDCTDSGFLTREYLRDEALAMVQKCIEYEINPGSLQVPISSDLLNRMKVLVCGLEATGSLNVHIEDNNSSSSSKNNGDDDDDDHVALSFLHDVLQMVEDVPSPLSSNQVNEVYQEKQVMIQLQDQPPEQQVQLTKEVILLALFGWSAKNDVNHFSFVGKSPVTSKSLPSQTSKEKKKNGQMATNDPSKTSLLVVSCPMCLCECSIACSTLSSYKSSSSTLSNNMENYDLHPPSTNVANAHEYPSKKRRHAGDGGTCHPPLMHLVHSHRHFCPMSAGFIIKDEQSTNSSITTTTTTRPGWETYLMSLCRGKEIVQNDGHSTTSSTGSNVKRNVQGADLLDKIRKALCNSFDKYPKRPRRDS